MCVEKVYLVEKQFFNVITNSFKCLWIVFRGDQFDVRLLGNVIRLYLLCFGSYGLNQRNESRNSNPFLFQSVLMVVFVISYFIWPISLSNTKGITVRTCWLTNSYLLKEVVQPFKLNWLFLKKNVFVVNKLPTFGHLFRFRSKICQNIWNWSPKDKFGPYEKMDTMS